MDNDIEWAYHLLLMCYLLQTNSDFDAKPMVMLLGQYSTGNVASPLMAGFQPSIIHYSRCGTHLESANVLNDSIKAIKSFYFYHCPGSHSWSSCSFSTFKIVFSFENFFPYVWFYFLFKTRRYLLVLLNLCLAPIKLKKNARK